MTKPAFVVPVADIERGPRTVTFTLDEAWLHQALEGTDATPRGPGSITVELSKNGNEVMVRGRAQVPLSMPCVVSLDPVNVDLTPEIFLMLAPEPGERRGRGKKPRAEGQPGTDARGAARKKNSRSDEEEGEELEATIAARDTYDGSQIELDPFFREFLVLDLPMFPRRSDLPLPEEPAIGAPPSASDGQEPAIDPRLQPLADLRSRLLEKD